MMLTQDIRTTLEHALYCIEVQNMHSWDEDVNTVEDAITKGYWCQLAVETRAEILALLKKLPEE